jgi:hypothetical protein
MSRHLTISALVLFIFIAGIFVGLLLPKPQFFRSLVHNRTTNELPIGPPQGAAGPPEIRQENRMMEALARRMKLEADQIDPFSELIRSHRVKMQEIMMSSRFETKQQIDSLNTIIDTQLMDILNEEQIKIWNNFRKRMVREGGPRGGRPRFGNPN